MKPNLIINGAGGRMGRRILALAVESERFDIVGAIERPQHPDIGADAGKLAGIGEINVTLESEPPDSADVMIDFSLPEATDRVVNHCAENIAKETGRSFPDCLVHGRHGASTLRKKGTIGIHAIRAGDITGEHSVILSTLGETIALSHSAHNRDNFVRGALRAAVWLSGKAPGAYSMQDVLGI